MRIQELLGHGDLKTTKIYNHTVQSVTIKQAKCPLDFYIPSFIQNVSYAVFRRHCPPRCDRLHWVGLTHSLLTNNEFFVGQLLRNMRWN